MFGMIYVLGASDKNCLLATREKFKKNLKENRC